MAVVPACVLFVSPLIIIFVAKWWSKRNRGRQNDEEAGQTSNEKKKSSHGLSIQWWSKRNRGRQNDEEAGQTSNEKKKSSHGFGSLFRCCIPKGKKKKGISEEQPLNETGGTSANPSHQQETEPSHLPLLDSISTQVEVHNQSDEKQSDDDRSSIINHFKESIPPNVFPEKRSPQQSESLPPNERSPQQSESLPPNERSPQQSESLPPNERSPEQSESLPPNERSPQQSESLPPKKRSPEQSESLPPNEQSPEQSESLPPNEQSPEQSESLPPNERSPEQSESLPPNERSPEQSESLPPNELSPQQSESLPPNERSPQQSESLPPNERSPEQSESLPPNERSPEQSESRHLNDDLTEKLPPRKTEEITVFQKIFQELGMDGYRHSKLSLKDVLNLGQENVQKIQCQTLLDVPMYFLRKLMSLSRNARDTTLQDQATNSDTDLNDWDHEEDSSSDCDDKFNSVHPLDVLCVLLHCSDPCLQQEILLKMSMCQYALPLLLPAGGGTGCTFMLWAMRAIVKRWRPQSSEDSKGFHEDNLVNISVPVFSFVRLGNCRTSKSRILNLLLSPAHQVQDFFLHREMETGNASRKISNGLVEICWYFPGSNLRSDIIKKPIAVTNMRGGLDTGEEQFRFLSHISSAVFVFTERVGEKECELLENSKKLNDTYIIIDPSSQTSSEELKDYRKLLQEKLNLDKKNVWERKRSSNDAALVRELKNIIADHINKSTNKRNLEEMSQEAEEMRIHVDESSKELQAGKTRADQIATNIQDIVEYKKETMKLQGELWKELSKTEKEMCRMRDQGSENAENYIEKLRRKCFSLREAQNKQDFPEGMEQFRRAVTELSEAEKQCFLKFTKFSLESVARNNLCKLQAEYKETFGNYGADVEKLKQIDQRISDSSLGIEHFLRELGQFYEAKYVMENGSNMEEKFSKLPSIAADLLLDGFPLELIDGDASNIPQQWISDVLSELDTKTGGKSRMRVITVLGVQSTGKSTLLNTMFGLQFPVASGRCTRGAFMTLIKVQDELQRELDCEFILVIDTEGLKSPELASLDDSYEHDNEMATLVVGLSDITIINMAMENTAEMKDILQLVIHAFLRMKQIGKKHNCQFVHQNVSDVSAHEKNLRDRQKLLQQLDKMTEIAARMEKKSQITTFSDIIDYNLEEHTWYIPGLWYGVPPMASVNAGYSDGVNELKKYLISYMKRMNVKAQTIPEYTEWIKSLWNAVKHEKFIFSFRNSLVSEAYNQLCMHYTGWEWNFQKAVYNWFTETETSIRNLTAEKLDTERKQIMQEMEQILRKEERNMSESLEDYFKSGCDNVHLLEPFRSDFFRSVKYLRKTQESALARKCADALRLQEDRSKVQKIQEKFLHRIEHKVTAIIKDSRDSVDELNDHMLKKEFENMWEEALQGLNIQRLSQRNIDQEILHYLKNIYSPTNEKLQGINSLDDYYWDNGFDDPLINKCQNYITEIISTKVNYDETYCHDLLIMIKEEHKQKPVDTDVDNGLPPLDLVVIIFKEAAEKFQTLHNQFVETNDPARSLDNLRSHYFSLFESMYKEKDECQKRARCFCEVCLKPAIVQHIQNHMGKELLDRILQKNPEFRTRKAFQFKVLQQLLKKNSFEEYNQYINNYKGFTQKWILNCIKGHYEKLKSSSDLYIKVLDSVMSKVKHASSKSAGQANNFSDFLDFFCRQLDKELVISQSNLKLIVFENKFNVSEFSNDVEIFLGETEKQIKAEMRNCNVETILSNVTMNPQEELYKKVIGCGKQCPFCKVPCEAGTDDHLKHFATIHRPIGLVQCNKDVADVLDHSICSTTVVSNRPSSSVETSRSSHPYKDYQNDYPDWNIHPEDGSKGTDYWKFVLKEHNHEFARVHGTQPAELPEDWKNINAKKALQSLKKSFNVKESHSN
ncbi:interferon-induced very large GTPase 1 isoform X1 [Xenopus tropicalis]|uniref:Interferon-induced very large GTPase 1 isoform X1 n=1 Tax=Xenopus tropicalis TaxID=8364 RepID=A0A8J1IUV1_XENTR|nr:interferon-induced very large GTPase 1 isoform X1 [Xenopus tropicalis]